MPMTLEWQPSVQLKARAIPQGVNPDLIKPETLAAFRSYYEAKGLENNQGEWENLLIRWCKTEYASPPKTSQFGRMGAMSSNPWTTRWPNLTRTCTPGRLTPRRLLQHLRRCGKRSKNKTGGVLMSQALFSITLEQDVIGAILENKTAFDAVSGIINDGDFYDLRHASLFRAVSYLSRQNQAHDALSVSHHLAKHGRLECIGGDAYIGDIVRSTHYAGESSIEARALQVRNLSSGRRLIASCQKIISMVESPTESSTLDDTINQAESLIMSIRDSQARENEMGPKPIKDVLNRTLDILESRVHTNGETGMDTGFDNLNEIIHGLHPKTLVIVAAVPGMGKTTFAINMIENAMLKTALMARLSCSQWRWATRISLSG